MTGSDERFRGHAPRPQAVATQPFTLDQEHLRPEAGRGLTCNQPRAPASDDDKIPHDRLRHSFPLRPVHVGTAVPPAQPGVTIRSSRSRAWEP